MPAWPLPDKSSKIWALLAIPWVQKAKDLPYISKKWSENVVDILDIDDKILACIDKQQKSQQDAIENNLVYTHNHALEHTVNNFLRGYDRLVCMRHQSKFADHKYVVVAKSDDQEDQNNCILYSVYDPRLVPENLLQEFLDYKQSAIKISHPKKIEKVKNLTIAQWYLAEHIDDFKAFLMQGVSIKISNEEWFYASTRAMRLPSEKILLIEHCPQLYDSKKSPHLKNYVKEEFMYTICNSMEALQSKDNESYRNFVRQFERFIWLYTFVSRIETKEIFETDAKNLLSSLREYKASFQWKKTLDDQKIMREFEKLENLIKRKDVALIFMILDSLTSICDGAINNTENKISAIQNFHNYQKNQESVDGF